MRLGTHIPIQMKTKEQLWILLLPILGSVTICEAQTTLLDGTFDTAYWSTTVTNWGGGTESEQQMLTGGNPSAYLQITHWVAPGPSEIVGSHEFLGGSYDPSTAGAITSLNYREDQIEFNPPWPGAAIGAGPLLFQNGVIYSGPDLTFTSLSWQTAELRGLTATDFTAGGSHPDFSAAGGVIRFGFWRSNGNIGAGYTTVSGIDNWSFTIISENPRPVLSIRQSQVAQVELSWTSRTNRLYQIQCCSGLTTNLWDALGVPIQGTGSNSLFYDSITRGQLSRFYRIECLTNTP